MSSIDEIASEWAIRCDAEGLDLPARAELDAWLGADRRHRGAYMRARATLRWIDQARGPAPPVAHRTREPEMPVVRPATAWRLPRPVWIRPAACAATAAAALAALPLLPSAPDYSTRVGQYREVALVDGSLAALNTDSQVDVAYSPDRRDITLRKGEAWFRVAHNRARPLEVRVGAVHVRATGTAFAVRSMADGARVVVTDGRVLAWTEGSSRQPIAISMGEQAFLHDRADEGPAPAPVAADIEQAMAWRRGEIGLDGETGIEAAGEFNRYSDRPVRVENPRAARYRLVGYFQTSQSLQFATALARITGSTVVSSPNEIVIE